MILFLCTCLGVLSWHAWTALLTGPEVCRNARFTHKQARPPIHRATLAIQDNPTQLHTATHTHSCIHAYTSTFTYTRSRTHVHSYTRSIIHSYVRTSIHTYVQHTHTHTHTHTHACGTYICTWRRTETCKKTNVTNHARIYGCTLQDHSRACTYHVLDAAAKTGVDSRRALAGKPLDDCSQLMQVILRLHPCLLRVLHARHWDECVRKIATIFHKALGIGKRLRTPLHTN